MTSNPIDEDKTTDISEDDRSSLMNPTAEIEMAGGNEDEPDTTPLTGESSPKQTVLVEAVAPVSLEGGQTFDVLLNGKVVKITVPEGGVASGQKFTVPVAVGTSQLLNRGEWKDGLCDCLSLGPCHPACWNACFFPSILMGQIMTRMRLTFYGTPGSQEQTKKAFEICFIITVCVYMLQYIFDAIIHNAKAAELTDSDSYVTSMFIRNLVLISFVVYLFSSLVKTRAYIRAKYGIDAQYFGSFEDFCCVFWCTCCTVSQMARHTATYEKYPAFCCSKTGIGPEEPGLSFEANDSSIV